MDKTSRSDKPIVGVLTYSLSGGGAERFTSYLLPYLDSNGVSVRLYVMNTEMEFPIPEHIQIEYLERSSPTENGLFKFLKIPFLGYKYAKLAKKANLTHSFSLLTRPNYINVLSKIWFGNKAKIIISERSFPSLQYGLNDFRSKMNKKLIPRLFPKADLVISNSHRTLKDLSENFKVPESKISVIHNPIDLEKINAIKGVADFFDASYFNLVTTGRLVWGKNHKMLIEAIKNLPKIRLYIIGDGELRNELERQIETDQLSDRVFLLGFDPNPYKYLKNADAFIFGSHYEGFPNVLLEAMACGLPVISTNCKSGPDEIMQLESPSDDNIMVTAFGILVPVDNAELMTKAITHLHENPAYLKKCGTKVRQRIRDFELESILAHYTAKLLE